MTFRRSRSALSALKIFYRVDIVVFCEGGQSVAVDDALKVTAEKRTLDTVYWSNVASFLDTGRSYHLKSVGCKVTLLAIAQDIELSGVSGSSVCMDSDYDRLVGRNASYVRLAYTHGYSWESDVLNRSVMDGVLRHLIGEPPPAIFIRLHSAIDQFETAVAKWCDADIMCSLRARPSIFDRDRPLRSLDMVGDQLTLREEFLRERLTAAGYRRLPRRRNSISPSISLRVMYGKLLGKYLYHLMVRIITPIVDRLRLDYDAFMRIAISETFSQIRSGRISELSAHFQTLRHCFI